MKKRLMFVGVVLIAGLIWSCERNNSNGELSISVASDLVCKGAGPLKTNDPAPEVSCINYSYDGDSILSMKHLNAGFNCCPDNFTVDIEIKGDSLIIREDDVKHGCKCNCLYNIEIIVRNLPADKYHVRIIESYNNYSWPRLMFELDLKKTRAGEVCVTRPEGWWR